MRYIAITR